MFGNERFLLLEAGEKLPEISSDSLLDSSTHNHGEHNNSDNDEGVFDIEVIDIKEAPKETSL